jgi:hypothetical protein
MMRHTALPEIQLNPGMTDIRYTKLSVGEANILAAITPHTPIPTP